MDISTSRNASERSASVRNETAAGVTSPAQLVHEAFERPVEAAAYLWGLLKGYFHKVYQPLRGRRFRAGRRFRVFGRLVLRGPGEVVFGDDVTVWTTVTPWTHSREAVITVGDHTKLSGTRMSCVRRITIGAHAIVADCRISDSDFHPLNRRDPNAVVRVAPIEVGDWTWIAPEVALMPGTVIGEGTVVSLGAICSGRFPANVVVVGNPARITGKVPGVEQAPRAPLADAPVPAIRDAPSAGAAIAPAVRSEEHHPAP